MKILLCTMLAVQVLIQQQAEAVSHQETTSYSCFKEDSKKCIIPNVSFAEPTVEVILPDLSNKTTLQIKRGNVPYFTEKLSDQLGGVEKLQLGPLNITELFLKPELVEVEAVENLIKLIKFRLGTDYHLQVLKLQDNRLTSLDGFEVLVNLKELRLTGNTLENIDMKVFKTLKELRLTGNTLENIDMKVFKTLENLERLYLDQNQIVTVVATSPVFLPAFEFFSLARNKIPKLDVTNWEFESLTELDISSNDLVHVEGFDNRFVSLQHVFVSSNPWHCNWLEDFLKKLVASSVTVKDTDKDCEGLTSANICCQAEDDSQATYDETFRKLDEMEKKQKLIQQTMDTKIQNIVNKQNTELSNVKKLLDELLTKEAGMITYGPTGSTDKKNFNSVLDNVKNFQATLDGEVEKFEKQKSENEGAKRQLEIKISELRRSLQREAKKIAEGQAHFHLLMDHVLRKLAKRETL